MLIYYVIFFYIILITQSNRQIYITNKGRFLSVNFCLLFLPMWLVMGLRYDVGNDFLGYQKMFYDILRGHASFYAHIENGYVYLNWILGKIFSSSVIIFLVTSFIIVFFFLSTIFERSRNIMISTIFFFSIGYYFNSMNLIRQFMAVAISFYALKYIRKETWFKFLVYILFASLFHKSVLIYVPLFFLLLYLKDKYFYLLSAMSFIFMNLAGMKLLSFLAKISFFEKFVSYNITETRFSILNVLLGSAVFLSTIIICKNTSNDLEKKNQLKLNWLALLAFIFLPKWGIATTRMAFYFTPVYILMVPDVIEKIDNKVTKICIVTILFAFCSMYLYKILIDSVGLNDFYPYVSVFSK